MIQAHGNKEVLGKFGEFCEAWNVSSLDETSEIRGFGALYDRARVKDSSIVQRLAMAAGNSLISDDSLITGSSRVLSHARVFNSVIGEAAVVGDDSYVSNSLVLGKARIMDKAEVFDSIVEGTTIVRGNSAIEGIHADKDYLFHEGFWKRLPLFYGRPDERYPIQECVDGKILIGCLCASINEWLSPAATRLAFNRFGISNENIQEYLRILRKIR